MKILGIVGSPRKGGNTDVLVDKVLEGTKTKGTKIEKIYLNDLNIRPCVSCERCSQSGVCAVSDDFQPLLQKIRETDCIVVGSPIYCATVTAQLKALIDRTDSSQVILEFKNDRYIFRSRFKDHKKGVIICVGHLSPLKDFEHTTRVMNLFLKDLGVEVIDEIIADKVSKIDDIFKRKDILQEAYEAGMKLIEESHGFHGLSQISDTN